MSFEKLGDITRRITNQLAPPVEYVVPINGSLANRLEAYAEDQRIKPETIIAEAVRAYVGDAA